MEIRALGGGCIVVVGHFKKTMDLTNKLERIEINIKNGLKFRAADRLRNMINQYPNESILWTRLAELYYESGFLASAGKYWILTEPKDEKIKKCVEIYEKSVNYSGTKILQDITFRGEKSKLTEYEISTSPLWKEVSENVKV